MRILMVNKFLYPRAGAETYMLTLSEELIAAGHDVMFFGMNHPENWYHDKSVCFDAIDFSIANSPFQILKNLGKVGVDILLGKSRRLLDELVDSFKPDIIHAHNIYNQISPGIFKNIVGFVPVVMTLHDFKPVCPSYNCFVDSAPCTRCLKGNIYNCVLHKCVQGSLVRSILAAGSAYYNRMVRTYKDAYSEYIAPSCFMKSMMVESGIDDKRITVVKNIATGVDSFTEPGEAIFYGGRLCEEKGVKTLIDAYGMLGKTSVQLRIAGTGADEEYFKRHAHKKGIDVIWLGRLKPEEIREELKKCRLTVTPSIWFENCSISILESLVSGRICIASDSGGNPELIDDQKNGWIFEAGSSDDLCDKLKKALGLSRDELVSMSRFACNDAAEKYNKPRHLDNIVKVYRKLIEEYK